MSRFADDVLDRAEVAQQVDFLEAVSRTLVSQAVALERFMAKNEVRCDPAVQDKVVALTSALQNVSAQVGDLYVRAYGE